MLLKKPILVMSGLILAASCFAAKPTSFKYIEEIIVADNEVYAHYVVKCSNGKEYDVSAWDNKKLWCVGKGLKDECFKKNIKAGKVVCKG